MAKNTRQELDSETEKAIGIRSKYAPKDNELDMLKRVYLRYVAMKDSPDRKLAEREWTRGRKQWEGLREQRPEDQWQSNHYVPLTTAVVEAALSEYVDQSPRPLILPRGQEDTPKATVMSHIYDYTWEVSDSDLEFEDILHDSLIEGTGIGQEYYYADMRKIKTGLVGTSKTDWNEEDKVDYNDCYLECVKNDDFFIDENARGFRGPYAARDCVRRYIMNIDDFRQFFKGPVWDPLGNAKFVVPGGDTNYYEWYKPPQGIDHEKMIEVLWYWSEKPDDWLCIVANDVMVVMGPNPYKHKKIPFARAIDVKRTHKFYGKGEPMLLESIQDELNTLRRMVIDRNHLDIDKMFIGSNRLNMAEDDLIARPHGFIATDDPDALKPIEYGDVPRSVEMSIKNLQDDATMGTGIDPRSQALPTTGTATEAALLKESTLKRIKLKLRRIELEFLTRVARLRVSNIMQYYPQARLEKIVGEVGTQEYQSQCQELQDKGMLQMDSTGKNPMTDENGSMYKKTYRQIRLKNVDLAPDITGTPQQKTKPGFNFFEAKPEYFLPNRGGYDIRFEAGSTVPISKPLMQSKYTDMYDRLIQLALGVPNTYDPKKLGDGLIKINDANPEDFSTDQQNQQQDDASARMQMATQLAVTEDNLMFKGKVIPPTAFAPPQHTLVHVQFTSSPPFQALKKDDPIVKVFIDHITGEIMAQENREASGVAGNPTPPGQPAAPGQPGQQPQMPAGQPPQGQVPGAQPVPTNPNAAMGGMANAMPATANGVVPPGV